MITLDQLTDIISKGEQFDVEFKSDRRIYVLYALSDEKSSVLEGKK
ncbi:hypothetical protein [Trichlorobacter lovleyi]|jgi:hypothetical protein|uniref:Uncharacterized protein n=1 Tax=Trichlorobacter lovleyi (strain ATCC BAA-1151 / DSM 17278 / SZ) TaxID=398767 RepID=B3EAP7_TRIL1|nr:hypothetical protein [Trichlorobacter lovleyi]ACD96930.1 hypothetical protein Glov_3224 [Trichlorobacter lovleyi SZ]